MTDRSAQIAGYLDGSLAPAAFADLCAWLNADEAHAASLVEQMVLESHLRESLLGRVTERPASAGRPHDDSPTLPRSAFRFSRWVYPLAAALLLAAAAVVIWLAALADPQPPPADAAARPIATVIDTRNVGWSSDPLSPGIDIAPQVIRTDRGELELMLRSQTMINLTGPAEMRLIGPMRVAMVRGRASFDCPHSAVGFAVDLPDGGRVVDLGTRFVVDLNADAADRVGVTEGSVELRTGDRVLTLDPRHFARRAEGVWTIAEAHRIADHSDSVRILPFGPASVAAGELEDSEHVVVFRERVGVTLRQALPVGVAAPGTHLYGDTRSGVLPAGTRVDSYLLHFDAAGDDVKSRTQIEASVTFERPILGLIPYASIAQSDAQLGAPGVRYESDKTRGLEAEDRLTLSRDRRTITVQLIGWRPDQVRVLVDASPSVENEPASAAPEGEPR